MSRNILLIPLFLAVLLLASTGSNSNFAQDITSKRDESKEPPLKYKLKVGDKSIAITEGETIRLSGTLNNPEITLTVQTHREFSCEGIAFNYPRAFVFDASLDDANYKKWTLSGIKFKIMYVVSTLPMTTENFANDIIDRIGREHCELFDATPVTFGNQKLSGLTLSVTLAGTKLVINIYRVPFHGAQAKFLVLQETLDSDGNRSIDGTTARDLLVQSFTLQQ